MRGGHVFDMGEVPEWSNGTDCKSVGSAFAGSNPALPTGIHDTGRDLSLQVGYGSRVKIYAGIAQLARASAFQAEGRGFESRFPLWDCTTPSLNALVAQLVEQHHGKV